MRARRGLSRDDARVRDDGWSRGSLVRLRSRSLRVGADVSEYAREFGKHVRSLRRARGVTQDVLAARSGLSPDTIRRIEHGSFSASIDTLRKLCFGLSIAPSTLFESFELGCADERRELLDLVSSRSPVELVIITKVIRVLLVEIDALAGVVRRHTSA